MSTVRAAARCFLAFEVVVDGDRSQEVAEGLKAAARKGCYASKIASEVRILPLSARNRHRGQKSDVTGLDCSSGRSLTKRINFQPITRISYRCQA